MEEETTFCTHKGYNTVAPCGKDCPSEKLIETPCEKHSEWTPCFKCHKPWKFHEKKDVFLICPK